MVLAEREADQAPRSHVQHRGQVELALVGDELGAVRVPLLIHRGRREIPADQVRCPPPSLARTSGVCLRRFLGRATSRWSRIIFATVFSLTRQPASRRSSVIRGEPYLQPLLRVAERLLGTVRTTDTVARLGGDEFAIVVPRRPVSVAVIADRIAETFARPLIIDARACCAGASTEFAHIRGGATTSPSTTSSSKPTSPVRR